MPFITKKLSIFAVLFFSFAGFAKTVDFHIKAGTNDKDWNTRESIVVVKVGDTLKLINDDSVDHALHTEDDIPFKHTKLIKPGSSFNAKILGAYDSEVSGPLHHHEFPNSVFWIRAEAQEDENIEVDAATISQVLSNYTGIQRALVIDDLTKAQSASQSIKELANTWLKENPNGKEYKSIETLVKGATSLETATDLDEARIAFINISQAAIEVIRSNSSLSSEWQLFFCPMVAKNKGYWVQPKSEKIANPYMGTTMPACGSKKPW